jgi:Icc protein
MKVVQITDIHLGGSEGFCMAEWPGRPTLASLSLVLDDIERRVPDLDALVVSGDIADLGLDDPGGYATLRRELARRGGGLLERCHVIPGNHDRRTPLLEAFPECRSDPQAEGAGGDPDVSFAADVPSRAADGAAWRLVGLDSGGRSFLLPGETRTAPALAASQLRRLADELGDARHAGKRTLLFMHHAPVAVGHYFDSPFADGVREPLESMLRESGRVEAIFTGHVHYECEAEITGLPIYASPSTCCQYAANTDPAANGEWMVASTASDHGHPAGIDPQAPTRGHALVPPGYRIIESEGEGRVETRCVWVTEAADVGATASL